MIFNVDEWKPEKTRFLGKDVLSIAVSKHEVFVGTSTGSIEVLDFELHTMRSIVIGLRADYIRLFNESIYVSQYMPDRTHLICESDTKEYEDWVVVGSSSDFVAVTVARRMRLLVVRPGGSNNTVATWTSIKGRIVRVKFFVTLVAVVTDMALFVLRLPTLAVVGVEYGLDCTLVETAVASGNIGMEQEGRYVESPIGGLIFVGDDEKIHCFGFANAVLQVENDSEQQD